jgi:hypothetical protein
MKNMKTLYPDIIKVDSNGGNLIIGVSKYFNLI